jgi:hypothetical protein
MGLTSRAAAAACAGALAAVLLAGCAGAAAPQPASASLRASLTRPVAADQQVKRQGEPAAGSAAEARQFGQSVLDAVVLPPGAARLPGQAIPPMMLAASGVAEEDPSVFVSRLYRVPLPAAAVIRFLLAHVPAGFASGDSGRSLGAGNVTVTEYLDESPRRLPAGVELAELDLAVAARSPQTSLLGIDAQVGWRLFRPAAEDFAAASYRAVTVTGQDARGRNVSRTFASRRVIGSAVSLLDREPVATLSPAAGCLLAGGPSVELDPLPGHLPVYAAPSYCDVYQIHVGTTREPALQGPFAQFAFALLTRPGTGRS